MFGMFILPAAPGARASRMLAFMMLAGVMLWRASTVPQRYPPRWSGCISCSRPWCSVGLSSLAIRARRAARSSGGAEEGTRRRVGTEPRAGHARCAHRPAEPACDGRVAGARAPAHRARPGPAGGGAARHRFVQAHQRRAGPRRRRRGAAPLCLGDQGPAARGRCAGALGRRRVPAADARHTGSTMRVSCSTACAARSPTAASTAIAPRLESQLLGRRGRSAARAKRKTPRSIAPTARCTAPSRTGATASKRREAARRAQAAATAPTRAAAASCARPAASASAPQPQK